MVEKFHRLSCTIGKYNVLDPRILHRVNAALDYLLQHLMVMVADRPYANCTTIKIQSIFALNRFHILKFQL